MIAGQVGIFLNSIEMMESGRCGRRKQRNPKRKNVENGTDNEDPDEASLDDNKNKIVSALSPSDSSYHSDRDEADCGPTDLVVKGEDTKPEPITKSRTEPTTEERVTAILKEIQSAAPDSTSDSSQPRQKSKPADDPRIAELLKRGDTAIIYPEPVSDGEEQQIADGASSDHDEEMVLKCMHCTQTFLRAIVLRDHMREKHPDKPLKFMCPKCDETFHQKSQLDKHLTLHSPTSQVCTVCNKTFANVYRLQRHMISHNESTDLRKFKCPECGKAFKFKHHLKEHVRIHSGEKPFVCNNCGKRFSHSGSFSSHTTSKKCWGLSSQKGRMTGQEGVQNLSQTNGQGVTGFGQKMPVTFANTKVTQFQRSPLQSVPVTMAHQQHFIPNPYTQQKGMPPFFFPPQMFSTTDGFLHPVFPVTQSLQHMPHGLALSALHGMKHEDKDRSERSPSVSSIASSARSTRSLSPHSQSTRSFSPHSYSGRSVSPLSSSAYSLSSPTANQPQHHSTPVPKPTKTSSDSSGSEQISPDVNSNTKLLIVKDEPKSSDIQKESNGESAISSSSTLESTESDSVPEQKPVNSIVKEHANSSVQDDDDDTDDKTDSEEKRKICQHCDEVFDSPVDHYQHERYLCKLNKDLVQRLQPETCQSPHSTMSDTSHVESTLNGSVENHSDEEEVEELYKDSDTSFDEKKMRIRSLFSEEQQSYLKSQYIINPRPRKYELIRIGNKIGFPKRVVQVWFQNMRARERKQGREIAFGLSKSETHDRDTSKSPTYIPNVPKLSTVLGLSSHRNTKHLFGPQPASKPSPVDAPLDLTVRRSPPLAHGGNLSHRSTPDRSNDDQVLNLSVKKDSSVEREKSIEKMPQPNVDSDKDSQTTGKSLQDSDLFKYMQREGMILSKHFPNISTTLPYTTHSQLPPMTVASMIKASFGTPTSCVDSKDANSEMMKNQSDSLSCSRLVIDETITDAEATSKDFVNYTGSCPSAVSTTDSMKLKLVTSPQLHEDTCNLATLAEAAQHAANILSGKPKRMRKKTWRQMESEEVQLDLDDSVSTDDDQPQKKKRKSWKNHRVDRDEGMYACDQCNKVFSKQSSLARHKYEHSGARPFACDMCTKSFKHKHHLTEHKRLHSGEKPFQCKKCGKRFSHSGSFSQHMNHRYNYCSPHKLSDGDGDGDELSSQDSP